MNLKHKEVILIPFTVCLLLLTSVIEAQSLPNWIKNHPKNTDETIYIVLEGIGETLEDAKNRASGDLMTGSISKNDIQLELGMEPNIFSFLFIDDEGEWFSNNAQFIDEFVTRNKGEIKYYAYYAIPWTAYNDLLELVYFFEPLLKGGDNIEKAIYSAANQLATEIPKNLKVAVINVASTDNELGEFALEELTGYLSSAGTMQLFDRKSLDSIRNERKFQMTGDVDDTTAVRIGHFAGADIVITGSITGSGSTRRLRYKALDVKTASILSQTSHRF